MARGVTLDMFKNGLYFVEGGSVEKKSTCVVEQRELYISVALD